MERLDPPPRQAFVLDRLFSRPKTSFPNDPFPWTDKIDSQTYEKLQTNVAASVAKQERKYLNCLLNEFA
jgi:hypothetical protein